MTPHYGRSMTNGVGSVSMQHPEADGSDRLGSGFGGAVVASLVVAAVVIGGWTVVLSHAYDAPSGPIESASEAGISRQQAVDAALADIGPPVRHQEVGREDLPRSIGTLVAYLPVDEAAGGAQRSELLTAWVERSAVSFPAVTDVPTFLACAALVGGDGGPSRCTLAGELRDQQVEFAVADDRAATPCASAAGPTSGYHVELFSGSAPSGQGRSGTCGGRATAVLPAG
jgi:hypothetical protein